MSAPYGPGLLEGLPGPLLVGDAALDFLHRLIEHPVLVPSRRFRQRVGEGVYELVRSRDRRSWAKRWLSETEAAPILKGWRGGDLPYSMIPPCAESQLYYTNPNTFGYRSVKLPTDPPIEMSMATLDATIPGLKEWAATMRASGETQAAEVSMELAKAMSFCKRHHLFFTISF